MLLPVLGYTTNLLAIFQEWYCEHCEPKSALVLLIMQHIFVSIVSAYPGKLSRRMALPRTLTVTQVISTFHLRVLQVLVGTQFFLRHVLRYWGRVLMSYGRGTRKRENSRWNEQNESKPERKADPEIVWSGIAV